MELYQSSALYPSIKCVVSVNQVSSGKKMKRGIWSEDEHERFLAAIELYPTGPWRLVSKYVGTRSCRQVQTHAQKYFEKVGRHQRGLQRERKGYFRSEHRILYPSQHDSNAIQPTLMHQNVAFPSYLGPANISMAEACSDVLGVNDASNQTIETAQASESKGRSESNDSILCSAELPSLEETLAVLLECLSEDESS